MADSRAADEDITSYLDTYSTWILEYDEMMKYLPRPRPWWEKLPRPYPPIPDGNMELRDWRIWWHKVLDRRASFKKWVGYLENPPWWGVASLEVSRQLTADMNQGLDRLRLAQIDRVKNNSSTPWHLLRVQCDNAHQEFMDNCPWYKHQYCGCDSGRACLQCWEIRPQRNYFEK